MSIAEKLVSDNSLRRAGYIVTGKPGDWQQCWQIGQWADSCPAYNIDRSINKHSQDFHKGPDFISHLPAVEDEPG